jgi:exodeoxyribonuclease VII small subunit
MKAKNETNEESFEIIFQRLEKSVEALQNESISLENAMASFEQGMKDYNSCLEILKATRQKILLFDKSSKQFKEVDE